MRMIEESKVEKSSERTRLIDYSGIEDLFPMMTKDDLNKVEQIITKNGNENKKLVKKLTQYTHTFKSLFVYCPISYEKSKKFKNYLII